MTRTTIAGLFLIPALLAQRPNAGPSRRPNPALEAALKEIAPLTSGVREDDHPALAERDGAAWVAWVSYSETEGNSHVYARSLHNGAWTPPQQITSAPGDYNKPAITIAADGSVFVAWPAQVNGNWDIYGRIQNPKSGWGAIERWTTHSGPDLQPVLAASKTRVMLVWQSFRKNSLDILYRVHDGKQWREEGFVTESPASDWEPVVTAAASGDFHVVWDSYRGDYDVMLRTMRASGEWGTEVAVAQSPRLENHAAAAMDGRNRLWIAWEAGPADWASDSAVGGLRARRDIEVACLDNGKLYRMPTADAALVKLGGDDGTQAPALAFGRDGRLRLFFRQPVNKNWLSVYSSVWDGNAWAAPQKVVYSEGRIDQRIVAAPLGDKILAIYPAGSSHNAIFAKLYDSGVTTTGDAPLPLAAADANAPKPAPQARPVHRLKSYRVVFGDLHRHTDISEDGGILDGSLIDTMRYAVDAAGLDFIGITDHTRYLPRRYNLWRMQQIADQYYHPGIFSPLHAYERSQYSPWGHRNIVNLTRNYVPVPGSYDIGDTGVSPWGLFEALRGKQAITIPHTSAWQSKQVSWDYYDPEIERLVEIYQGMRSTYEYKGAPDPADQAIYEPDSKSFVWDALARKRRLGFIASSDHQSTHKSFAAVYVKNVDRASIFESLRARRTYAATDKIMVDFTLGEHLMGEEVAIAGTPEFQVNVEGTAALARIDIIKDGTFVYTSNPNTKTAKFTYRDQMFDGAAESYYYVRVIQADKMMAWASPIWVTRK